MMTLVEDEELDFNDVMSICQRFQKRLNINKTLGDLTQHALFDLCWVQNHLDDYSKDYLKNIILQYQENLSSYATFKLTEAELKLLRKELKFYVIGQIFAILAA